jgi:hypothetical protein
MTNPQLESVLDTVLQLAGAKTRTGSTTSTRTFTSKRRRNKP